MIQMGFCFNTALKKPLHFQDQHAMSMNVNLKQTTVILMLIVWTLTLAFSVSAGLVMKGMELHATVCPP